MKLERWQEDEIDGTNQRRLEAKRIANQEREAILKRNWKVWLAERRAAVARAKKGE